MLPRLSTDLYKYLISARNAFMIVDIFAAIFSSLPCVAGQLRDGVWGTGAGHVWGEDGE